MQRRFSLTPAQPSTKINRLLVALCRNGLIVEYSGESYHARAFSTLSKPITTIKPFGGSPSSDCGLPPRTT